MCKDIYVNQVVGLPLRSGQLGSFIDVQSCGHEYPSNYKFCPECGKRSGKVRKWKNHDFITNEEGTLKIAGITLHQVGVSYNVVVGFDTYPYQDNEYVCDTDDDGEIQSITIPSHDFIEESREKVRQALEPLGLWDESKFGVYNVLSIYN